MILSQLHKTSEASPTQWQAINERGERVYIRFRFDTLTVHCPYNDSEDQTYEDFLATQVLCLEHVTGEPFAGALETDEMLSLIDAVEDTI